MHLPHTLATEPSLHGPDHTAHVLNLFVVLVASVQGWAVGGGLTPSTLSCLPVTPPAPGLRPQASTTCAGLFPAPLHLAGPFLGPQLLKIPWDDTAWHLSSSRHQS